MNLRATVFLLAITASGVTLGEGQDLKVTLEGIKHDQGDVRVALFSEPKTFRKADQAFASRQAPATIGAMTLTFEKVPAGQYAIMAYHDENGNGDLDRRFGMFPTEGYGLSNNPKVMGPPAFEDSQFEVTGDSPGEIRIDIRY